MNRDDLIKRMCFIIYGENRQRIKLRFDKAGFPIITYDVHGLTVSDAKRNIHNIVNANLTPVHLTIIHGYHHGDAIKTMITEESFFGRLKNRYTHKPIQA